MYILYQRNLLRRQQKLFISKENQRGYYKESILAMVTKNKQFTVVRKVDYFKKNKKHILYIFQSFIFTSH